jgi:hypothetical protein
MKGAQPLLFLKHVEKITISQKKNKTPSSSNVVEDLQTLYCIELSNVDQQTRKQREFLEEFARKFEFSEKTLNLQQTTVSDNHRKGHQDTQEEDDHEEEDDDDDELSMAVGLVPAKSKASQRKDKKRVSMVVLCVVMWCCV